MEKRNKMPTRAQMQRKANNEEEPKKKVDPAVKEWEDAKKGIRQCAATPEGRAFLRLLRKECNVGEAKLSVDPQSREVNVMATVYACSREGIWLKIAPVIPRKELVVIEHPEYTQQEEEY